MLCSKGAAPFYMPACSRGGFRLPPPPTPPRQSSPVLADFLMLAMLMRVNWLFFHFTKKEGKDSHTAQTLISCQLFFMIPIHSW